MSLLQLTLPPYDIQIIQNYIQPHSNQDQLIDLYYQILDLNSDNLYFYTDASIKNLQILDIKAEIG